MEYEDQEVSDNWKSTMRWASTTALRAITMCIHKQFPFLISLGLPLTLTKQVLLLALLSRWEKKGGIIRWHGQDHWNQAAWLWSLHCMFEQSRKQKNANGPPLPRVTVARERSQTDCTYIRDHYFSWGRRTAHHKRLLTEIFTLKIKIKYAAITLCLCMYNNM